MAPATSDGGARGARHDRSARVGGSGGAVSSSGGMPDGGGGARGTRLGRSARVGGSGGAVSSSGGMPDGGGPAV